MKSLKQEEEQLRQSDADLQSESLSPTKNNNVDASTITSSSSSSPYIPLALEGRTHVVSLGSQSLMRSVTLDDLRRMTALFYEKAFQDETLDRFIHSHDDPHGERFATWIHQKLSGSSLWDANRRQRQSKPTPVAGGTVLVHDRTSAHVAAWHSLKRPPQEVGRHFTLEEARVWMRLHFWALRESGLMQKSPAFADYYVRFIAHFVRVYERTAPVFARDSLRWSANPHNIQTYIDNGRKMKDVLGLSLDQAEEQIPEKEANDFVWPYNSTRQ